VRDVDAIIITVPTPLTNDMTPDLSYVESTAREVAAYLQKEQIVSLESTTYPGTTRDVLIPLLEEKSGLKAGRDFHVAYSPERVDPGNKDHDLTDIPKVVSGLDDESLSRAVELYSEIIHEVVPVSTLEAAEMTKLLENIYRTVNIALVNEMKMLADRMGLNIWEVIEAAATKPFGYQAFYPGPGLGGHCLPIDPFYLYWAGKTKQGFETQFIELAGKINTGMPAYVMGRLKEALATRGKELRGAAILIIGVAYKPDVSDTRESPGLHLMSMLEEAGAEVGFHDPYVPVIPQTRDHPQLAGRGSTALDAGTVGGCDAVIVVTNHSSVDYRLLAEEASLIVDTRNAMKGIECSGVEVVRA
jgi:UDP-N-acetyl-D-glucosamine dehydrogenase